MPATVAAYGRAASGPQENHDVVAHKKGYPRGGPRAAAVTPSVIKKLFAYSGNRCANPLYKQDRSSISTALFASGCSGRRFGDCYMLTRILATRAVIVHSWRDRPQKFLWPDRGMDCPDGARS